MNAQQLLALYDRVADAPGAIARLRRLVLDLAVRGKLVEQDAGDEPASDLLKRIAAEKARLVKAGEIKVRKLRARERSEPLEFTFPTGWVLTELGTVAMKITDGAHKTPTYVNKGVPFVSVKDFSGGKLDLSNTRFIPEAEHQALYQRCDPRRGDILLGRIGTLGKAILVDTDVEFSLFVSVGLIRFDHQNLLPEFFRLLLNSPFVEEEFDRIKIGGGTHTNKLNLGDLHTVALPLPPLAEQHRIVAKVEELMALLDRLEAARAAREATRDRLTAASLARLTAPAAPPDVPTLSGPPEPGAPSDTATSDKSAKDFPAHARFALATLPALTTRPDQIKPLRQTILNLAVRGKLVAQDPADEPASELLNRIAAERAELIKLGEICKQKPLPPFEESEIQFSLPNRWTWCRLGSLVLASDAGWSPRTENHAREGDAWGILKVSAVSWDQFDSDANKQVLPGTEPRLQAQVRRGDFLISRANTAELVARAVLVQEEPLNLMMSDKIVRLRLATDCDHRFAWLVNNYSDYGRDYYAANATGVSPSMKNVSRAVILNLPVPLPPLAEQHRIVARVDALMALCDRLEAALTTADTTRARLLEALLHEALEPASADAMEAAE